MTRPRRILVSHKLPDLVCDDWAVSKFINGDMRKHVALVYDSFKTVAYLDRDPQVFTGSQSILIDVDSAPYALKVANLSSGANAIGQIIVGAEDVGGGTLGAAIAIKVASSSHTGEILPGSGVTGAQAIIHTGASIPIGLATADTIRIFIQSDGSPTVVTTDLSINKSAAIDTHGEIVLNGSADAKLELQSSQVERGYVFASSTEMILGSVTAIDLSFIYNSARVLSFNGANSTAAATPTLTANKPGANAGVITWLSVKTGAGTQGWMPVWGN